MITLMYISKNKINNRNILVIKTSIFILKICFYLYFITDYITNNSNNGI